MNEIVIKKCCDCSSSTPYESDGNGVWCDYAKEIVSLTDADIPIPDWCPRLNPEMNKKAKKLWLGE